MSSQRPPKSINKRSEPLDSYVVLHYLFLNYYLYPHTWPDYCSKEMRLFLDYSLLFDLFLALADRIAGRAVDVRHI